MRITEEQHKTDCHINRIKLLQPKWYRKINYKCDSCKYQIIDEPIWMFSRFIYDGRVKDYICLECAKDKYQALNILENKVWK